MSGLVICKPNLSCRIGEVSMLSTQVAAYCVNNVSLPLGQQLVVSPQSSRSEVVGTGLTMAGTVLHGHELPAGYVKVAIETLRKISHHGQY